MVKLFRNYYAANDRYKAGKSDFNVIAKDATMDVKSKIKWLALVFQAQKSRRKILR